MRGRYQAVSLKFSYTSLMKEAYIPGAELTQRQAYSTLNTAHSLSNERFVMDSTPKENRLNLSNERKTVPMPPDSSPEQGLAVVLAKRIAENQDQAGVEVHKILEQLGYGKNSGIQKDKKTMDAKVSAPAESGNHGYDVLMKQKAEDDYSRMYPRVPENQADQEFFEKVHGEREVAQFHPDLKDLALVSKEFPYGDVVEAPDITDGTILSRLAKIQRNLNNELSETEGIKDILKAAPDFNDLLDKGVSPDQVKKGIAYLNRLREIYGQRHSEDQEDKRFRGFSLQWTDMRDIKDDGPIAWMDGQFDILYDLAVKGEILDSPQVRALEGKFNEAVGYLLLVGTPIEEVVEVQNNYNIRTSLIFARASIDRRNLEGVQGSVVRLKTNGLFTALSFNEGRAGAMLNRLADMVNNMRVSEGGFVKEHGHATNREQQHLDNKMVNMSRDRLILEQFNLAIHAETGIYRPRYEAVKASMLKSLVENSKQNPNEDEALMKALEARAEDKARANLMREIRRDVNVAYDVYGVTQMQAVEASRGKRIYEQPYTIFTDPKSFMDFLNIEEFLTNKWGSLQHEQEIFLRQMKLDMVQNEASGVDIKDLDIFQKEELGTRMFKELFTVPDFYSSGWRMRGMMDQIERVQKYSLENQRLFDYFKASAGKKAPGEVEGLRIVTGDSPRNRKDRAAFESLTGKISELRESIADMSPADKTRKIAEYERQVLADKELDDDEKKQKIDQYARVLNLRKNLSPTQKDKSIHDFLRNKLTLEERSLYIDRVIANPSALWQEAKTNAGEFALFMQLKRAGTGNEKKRLESAGIWKKIQKYRPEEMIRIARERKGSVGDTHGLDEIDAIFTKYGIQSEDKLDFSGNKVTIRAHDVFRRDYAPVLAMIREKAYKGTPPQQVDFRSISEADKAEINKALDGIWVNKGSLPADSLKSLLAEMDLYIKNTNLTHELTHSSEYEDLYARTVKSDDVLLDQLENVPDNMPEGGVSSFWAAEGMGDALVRNYNDIAAAQKAGGALVSFLKTEGKDEYRKYALEFAHHVADYNGTEGAAKALRYTYGSFLLMAEQDYLVDILGVGKLGRFATSDIERIFGAGVSPMTREELLKEMDHIRGHLTSGDHSDPEKYYQNLMNELSINGFDRFRDKSATLGIYLVFLLLLGSSLAAGAAAFKEASK